LTNFCTKIIIIILLVNTFVLGQMNMDDDWDGGYPDGCTTIMVGKKATADGSVITSHTCDSHRTRSWFDIISPKKHKKNSQDIMVKRGKNDSLAMPTYKYDEVGEIPQVSKTFGYINTAYPCMNDHQLAIGESTFGGRKTLCAPKAGIIDCQQLVKLMIERCTTAREAIVLADKLTKKYGYNDYGECLTIADTKEVWMLEILGPGKGNVGAIWVARRVPDDHVSVCANGSRIRKIDLKNTNDYMASTNIFQVAQDSGWWNPENGEFEFCYVYSPESRTSLATRRREWRVFDLLAPSLKLNSDAENYPFSVKPDTLVTIEKLVDVFRDYYQGTRFDMSALIKQEDNEGKSTISPFANPFMPYDMNKLFGINGGWGWRGERQIARWYTMYATITQSRSWLPDEIGGLTWLALDNVATSVYVPIWCSVTDVAKSYKTPGRTNGYTRDSGWWAFNRLSTLTGQRWGDIYPDILDEMKTIQAQIFEEQRKIETEVLLLYKKSSRKAIKKLTDYSMMKGEFVIKKAWKLGDDIWTKYDEKF